jgi:hypothetical protein
MHRFGGLPAWMAGAAVVALSAFLALYFAAAMALFGVLRRNRLVVDALVFAGCWLLAELARELLFTGFPWAASGYAHVDSPLAWLAPWLGVHGIGWAAALLGALAVIGFRNGVGPGGLGDRAGVGQAGGLDHDAVEAQFALAALFGQVVQRGAQVFADRAADAAVVQLDDLLLGVLHQDLVVDVLVAELVLDHGDLLAVRFGQHALEQRGLARAEEAGQDGGGDEAHGMSVLDKEAGQMRPKNFCSRYQMCQPRVTPCFE